MKRIIYLVVAALVGMVVIAPPAAAQGENLQQALQQTQNWAQQAQQYMQSPEGQQAVQTTQERVQEAQQYMQSPEGQQARENAQQALQQAQDSLQQAQQYMQSPEGEQALQQARDNLQQAVQQFQKAREGAQERMQEVTKIERTTQEGLPQSGGVPIGSIVLPAAALLVGSGVLAYATLRGR